MHPKISSEARRAMFGIRETWTLSSVRITHLGLGGLVKIVGARFLLDFLDPNVPCG